MKPLRGLLPVGAPCWLESIAGTRTPAHKGWRRRPYDPPDGALYGAQKVAKTKRAAVDRSC